VLTFFIAGAFRVNHFDTGKKKQPDTEVQAAKKPTS